MDLAITKENIFLAKCVMYDRREGDYLIRKPLEMNDEYRVILFFNGKVIDFELADDLPILPIDLKTGEIIGEIKADTYYIEDVHEYTQLTNEELEYVPTLLARYQENKLKEQAIKKSKKISFFPKKRLN